MAIIHRYYVRGTGKFPFHLLHYHQGWPSSLRSADEIGSDGPRLIGIYSLKLADIGLWLDAGWIVTKETNKTLDD